MKTLRKPKQSGFTMIELMFAIFVLAVGLSAGLVLVMGSIGTNNRNKLDTTATMLSQNVMEQFLAVSSNTVLNIPMSDCQGNNFTINTQGAAAPGAGATLTAAGTIDFSAASPGAGYSMLYVVCRATGDPVTYDVRWNVTNLRTGGTGGTEIYTKQITVAARPLGAAGNASTMLRYFALPVTMRGVAGF
jgi:prepilin-type N-terminal cleavage/methylation domain-containing protein